MSEASTGTARFSPRTIKYALIASLALNVLIIGGIIGSICFSPHGPRHRGPKSPLLGFAATLPSDRGDMIRQKVADAQEKLEGLRKAERDAWHAMHGVLVADPFDQNQLQTALEAAITADGQEKLARMTVFVETAGQLTPAERKELHEWLEKRRSRRR